MFCLAHAQLLTGLCFCWVTGGMGVEEIVAESFIEKWMGFILFFRSDAARSCSAIFWLPSSRTGHALCCHPLGKQVWRILYSSFFLETKKEIKLFFPGRHWQFWGNKSRIVLLHLMHCGPKQWKIQQKKKSTLSFWVRICLSSCGQLCKLVELFWNRVGFFKQKIVFYTVVFLSTRKFRVREQC